MSSAWTDDPTVQVFLARHASPPAPHCEMLVDGAGRCWAYESMRHAWVNGDEWWPVEDRQNMETQLGPLSEVWV